MKILYISSVPSEKQFNYMKEMLKPNINNAKYGMQESGYKFHHLIMDGIVNNHHEVYSLVGRPISSKSHQKIYWKSEKEKTNGITYHHIALINIPVIKNIFACFSYFFKVLKWIKNNQKEEKCIILDAAYITVIPFVNLATFFCKCEKVAIVCDIYEYMANVKDARKSSKKIHNVISRIMLKQYQKINGFVFLTEAMNSILNLRNKPYIIMEGLVDQKMLNQEPNNIHKKAILYAGALREEYGVKNLIDGFMNYHNDDIQLWIYGAGDYANDIEEKAKIDGRIKYYGIVSNDEIVKKEQEATFLINPRSANQEFTKYSFPSKNMEYMASGTPLITTKLPGMPKEYYPYVYLIDGDDAEDITNALNKAFSKEKKEIIEKGLLAREFVLEKKNNTQQAKRIINLCKMVIENEKK